MKNKAFALLILINLIVWTGLGIVINKLLSREFDVVVYSNYLFVFFVLSGLFIIGNTILKWRFFATIKVYFSKSSFKELAYSSIMIPISYTLAYIIIIESVFVTSKTFSRSDLTKIDATIAEVPEYISHPKRSADLHILLKEYSNYIFEPRIVAKKYQGLTPLRFLHIDDPVNIYVLRSDSKIIFANPAIAKVSEPEMIPVFEVDSRGVTFYGLETDTKLAGNYDSNRIFYFFVSFFFIVPLIQYIHKIIKKGRSLEQSIDVE